MKRNVLYFGVAGIAGGLALWITATAEPPRPVDPPPRRGLYTIVFAIANGQAMPEAAGRPFVLRHDGPDLVGAPCPDVATCRRWLDGPATFRSSLDPAATLDPTTILASPLTVRESRSTTTTEAGCRRRLDVVEIDETPLGLQLRRRISQTALVADCAHAELTASTSIELTLVRVAAGDENATKEPL